MSSRAYGIALERMVNARGEKSFRQAYLAGLETVTKDEKRLLTREASRIVHMRSYPRECLWTKEADAVLAAMRQEEKQEKQKAQDTKRFKVLCGVGIRAYSTVYTGTDDDEFEEAA